MWTDWRWQRIPNVLTYPAIVVGLALAGLEAFPGAPFQAGLLDHLVAVVAAFALLYPIYAVGWLKAGDVKMLMAIGALKGPAFLLATALYGSAIGGVIALAYIGVRRIRALASGGSAPIRELMRSWIPYGIALGLGALAALAVTPS